MVENNNTETNSITNQTTQSMENSTEWSGLISNANAHYSGRKIDMNEKNSV